MKRRPQDYRRTISKCELPNFFMFMCGFIIDFWFQTIISYGRYSITRTCYNSDVLNKSIGTIKRLHGFSWDLTIIPNGHNDQLSVFVLTSNLSLVTMPCLQLVTTTQTSLLVTAPNLVIILNFLFGHYSQHPTWP